MRRGITTVDDVVSRDPLPGRTDLGWASLAGILSWCSSRPVLVSSLATARSPGTRRGQRRRRTRHVLPRRHDLPRPDRLPSGDGSRSATTLHLDDHRHLHRKPRCATNLPPSPAAGSPRSRSRSPMRSPWATPMSRTSTPTWMPSRRSSARWADRYVDTSRGNGQDHRPILGSDRSMGSVIKLPTPPSASSAMTTMYLSASRRVPSSSSSSSAYRPEWVRDWRSHFGEPPSTAVPANRLRLDGQQVLTILRVGFESDGSIGSSACGRLCRGGQGPDRGRYHRLDRRAQCRPR